MNNGLYEKILDSNLKKRLKDKNYKETRNVDKSELANVLSISYQKMIREILSQKENDKEKQRMIKELNKAIGIEGFEFVNYAIEKRSKKIIRVYKNNSDY